MLNIKGFVKHPLVIVLSRFILGGIFIVASFGKIQNPQAFADILYNYKLLPGFVINFLAVYLPWLEMMAGLCLMAGIFTRTNAIILSSLLVVFIVVVLPQDQRVVVIRSL
jgi:putative oxidoreductase